MHERLVVSSIIYGGSTEYGATVCRSPVLFSLLSGEYVDQKLYLAGQKHRTVLSFKKNQMLSALMNFFFFFFQLKTTPVWKVLFEGLTPCTHFIVRADPVRQSPT